jgi:hypothetical protein
MRAALGADCRQFGGLLRHSNSLPNSLRMGRVGQCCISSSGVASNQVSLNPEINFGEGAFLQPKAVG